MDLTRFIKLGQIRVGLPSGEDIWFSLDEGLNLVYGKNGSGKSTTLRAIARVFRQNSSGYLTDDSSASDPSPKPLVTAYYETEYIGFNELLSRFLDGFVEFLKEEQIFPVTKYDLPGFGKPESLVEPTRGFHQKLQGDASDELCEAFDRWVETADEETRIEHEETFALLREVIELGGQHNLDIFDDLKTMFEQLRTGLVKFFSEIYSNITVDEANEVLESFGLKTRLEAEALSDRSLEPLLWAELVELYLVCLAWDYHVLLQHPFSEWGLTCEAESELTLEEAIPQLRRISSTVLQAFENQMDCPTFWIEPTNKRDGSRQLGLALGRSKATECASDVESWTQRAIEAYDEVYEIYESSLNGESDVGNELLNDATFAFLSGRVVTVNLGSQADPKERRAAFESYRSNPRYLNLDRLGNFFTNDHPIRVVNLDDGVNLEEIASKTLFRLVAYHLKEATFINDNGVQRSIVSFEEEGLEQIQEATERISYFLVSLDIGILRCEFRYSEQLLDWTFGFGASFVFFTDSTVGGKGIDFGSLSRGQQYWVSAAFQICFAELNSRGYLLIADEPERGLHERAATAAFSALAGLSATSLIATHSVSALRFAGARLMNFERSDDGKIRLTDPQLGDNISKAAQRFGTTPFDLFSLKRALVVVEGAHDVEIVRHLASCSPNPQLLDRLLIVPARGVKNVATVADSVVITEFTNLHILTIIDNGRTAALQAVVDRAATALQEGKSTQQAIKESGIRELAKDSSFEERSILDLVERAIHRRILGRLHLLALSVPDIVDLLPEKSFGLKKSWSELRREYGKSGHRDGFKSWLKLEYDVSISTKTVSRAVQQLDVIDGDLHRISSELEIVASLSPLDSQS